MGTFTLSQTRTNESAWFYPLDDGCVTELNSSQAGQNYLSVDEDRKAPNEDTDYVYTTATDLKIDVYMTDHDILNAIFEEGQGTPGDINFVQIFARAKSYIYTQSPDGDYRIVLTLRSNPESECSDLYLSDKMNLTTGYQTFNEIWTLDPSTDTAWTWEAVGNLEIGIKCSSPTIYLDKTAIFRPNADGDNSEHYAITACKDHNYECVDETIPDESGTVIINALTSNGEQTLTDLYNIPNHTTETGTISKVAVFYRTKKVISGTQGTTEIGAAIKIGGNTYYETMHDITTQWVTYSEEWVLNPSTATIWTWNDIDSLQVGVKSHVIDVSGGYSRVWCTQVYLIVYYEGYTNPEIRTTQVYAKIDYNVDYECTLNKPREVSVDHARNIKMLNFWSGNRAVYDVGRSNKTMVLTGMETGEDACDRIMCIRGLGENGSDITTDGLSSDFDDTFKIISFGWKLIGEAPIVYEWILELEYTEI